MQVSATDALQRYYTGTSRGAPGFENRVGIRGHVDALLNHLEIPARLDPDGDWLLTNDAGTFTLFARQADERVVLRQKVMKIEGDDLGDYAGDLQLLLMLNLECEGACFASQATGDGFMVVLTGQLSWEGLDADKLAKLLAACFGLAADLDEALREGDSGPDLVEAAVAAAEPVEPVGPVEPEPEPEPEHLGTPPAGANGNGSWPANWYEDPKGEARLRYWDGSAWTDHTAA